MAGAPGRFPVEEHVLRDGSRVLVRPILPEDRQRLRDGMHELSELTRYRRFLSAVKDLSDKQLRYLTEIDYVDHMAWIALDPLRPGHPVLGVARYIRLPDEQSVAEVAVTIVDSFQGRGLGTLLLGLLCQSAVANGVRVFRAYVLAENAPVRRILDDLGASTCREGFNTVRFDLPVPEMPTMLSGSLTGQVFKEIAAQHARDRKRRSD